MPSESGFKKIDLNQARALATELCKYVHLPEIEVKKLEGSSRLAGMFSWRNFFSENPLFWLSFNEASVDVGTVVHEVAHYWDYYNRHPVCLDLDRKGKFKERNKVYRQHGHSRKHWNLMENLFNTINSFPSNPVFSSIQKTTIQFSSGHIEAIKFKYRLIKRTFD